MDASFEALYKEGGRPSIPPERLLRASLLQMLYTIRSERQLVERLEYDLLFRWFTGLGVDDVVFDASSFSKNRDRLLTASVAQEFLSTLLGLPQVKKLLSADHFSVDGTLLKAWCSMKSFRAKDGSDEPPPPATPLGFTERSLLQAPPTPGRNGERDFKTTKRSNATHASTTDPDARLYRKGKGQESKLAYLGHALMENRNGLVVGAQVTQATGTAEREAATALTQDLPAGATLGADKNYDVEAFVEDLKAREIEPHVAINGTVSKLGTPRKTAVPPTVSASLGYAISQRCRKRIEESFGWSKMTGGLQQLKVQGLAKVQTVFCLRHGCLQSGSSAETAAVDGRIVSRYSEVAENDGEKPPSDAPILPKPAKNRARSRTLRLRNTNFSSLLGPASLAETSVRDSVRLGSTGRPRCRRVPGSRRGPHRAAIVADRQQSSSRRGLPVGRPPEEND